MSTMSNIDPSASVMFINGISPDAPTEELSKKIKDAFLKASQNLSWLSPGDTVLLKPALNSPGPYPATTHPESVQAVAGLLQERDAKVIVADQSGVEFVLRDGSRSVKGSSKKLYEDSGMARGISTDFIGFEESGWEEGFYNYQSAQTTSWPDGFYMTNWIKKADHIVNLPRLSTHAMAGITLGFKNMAGLLREDSRLHFHANGPFYFFMKRFTKEANLDTRDDKLNSFFQKITEISLALEDKLRVTLFTATRAQVTFGPNEHLFVLCNRGIGAARQAKPETGLIFASSDPVAAEVCALAFLTLLYVQTPSRRKLLHKLLQVFNRQTKELGKQSPWDNPFVKHALALGLGRRSVRTEYDQTPRDLQTQLDQLINTNRGGNESDTKR